MPIGLVMAAIAGTWMLMGVTGQVLYPNPQAVPAVTYTDPSQQWSEPVDRAHKRWIVEHPGGEAAELTRIRDEVVKGLRV